MHNGHEGSAAQAQAELVGVAVEDFAGVGGFIKYPRFR